jgi:very-short-patch-repair endonuclease
MYEVFNRSKLLDRRKELRHEATAQEKLLWYRLKGKQLGFKFRRQHGIGGYIVDFYCKEKNLVIELDGLQHLEAKDYDELRDRYLQSLDLTVLRFWNKEIDEDIEKVIDTIKKFLA